jgi:DNA-binding NtrC family response regulator
VVVNCGAIPEGLIESELFGAEKGAYTGSVERRTGYFEEADGGTLFLDEIGEMPLQAQVRLLRVLETGQFSRVGSSTTQQTNVRVVAASNKNLAEEVAAGRFREDLYYRLSTVLLMLPPLRERAADIVPLFETFLRQVGHRYNATPPRLDASATALLQRYPWPGNVRELRNVAEQTVVLVREPVVTADALRPFLRGVSAGAGLAVARAMPTGGDSVQERALLYRALLEIQMEVRALRGLLEGRGAADPVRAASESAAERALIPFTNAVFGRPLLAPAAPAANEHESDGRLEAEMYDESGYDETSYDDAPFEMEPEPAETPSPAEAFDEALARGLPLPTMEHAERALIREALRRLDGNRRETARVLGMSERTLYRKIKDLGDDD